MTSQPLPAISPRFRIRHENELRPLWARDRDGLEPAAPGEATRLKL
ncbi:MAG: hypothetical protein MJE68_32870 [Proteobacteria bacterium]|nr:hypothetical protein [Pseudomonadota bacterium]